MANDSKKFKWSARFLDKYTVTDDTTVTLKCLNTDKTWEFTEETGTKNSSIYYKRYTDSGILLERSDMHRYCSQTSRTQMQSESGE